jgi:signal transduction histidine kinase
MVGQVRADAGLESTTRELALNLFRLFCCSRIVVAARERDGGRARLWTAQVVGAEASPRVQSASLERSSREAFFSSAPACWHARRRGKRSSAGDFEIVHQDPGGNPTCAAWSRFKPRALDVLRPRRSCMSAAFEFGPEWTCRLFIVDSRVKRSRQNVMRLAQDLVAALAPALYNCYVAERLRTGAADTKRANLARALHDGVIQSLIAAEMEVHAAWRRSLEGSNVSTAELRRIQDILHNEVLGLRDLMQRIKPVQIQPEELCDALSDCVARFKADTGVGCSFSASVEQVSLTPASCALVVRIVQEALSNVRKHSGARNVRVDIGESGGQWRLVVEDDGRGFDASGVAPSPVVVRECVRSLDGDLQVVRSPGGGLRLEIAFTGYVASRDVVDLAGLVTVHEGAPVAITAAPIRRRGTNGQVVRRPAMARENAQVAAERPDGCC